MAINTIGSVAYANQAMPAQSRMQSNYQNRLDMQAGAANAIQDADKQEIEDVRPAEETYKIDPEHEQEKKRSEQEQEESKEETSDAQTEQFDEETSEPTSMKHLDIKV